MQLVDFTELIQYRFTKLKVASNGQPDCTTEHGVVDIAVTMLFAHAQSSPRRSGCARYFAAVLKVIWLRAKTEELSKTTCVARRHGGRRQTGQHAVSGFVTRTCNGMKMSSLRVMYTFILPFSIRERKRRAYLQLPTSFSRVLYFPTAPESSPPVARSSIMTIGMIAPCFYPVVDHLCWRHLLSRSPLL